MAGTVTLVMVAVIDAAVVNADALPEPVGPVGPVAPGAPLAPAEPVVPLQAANSVHSRVIPAAAAPQEVRPDSRIPCALCISISLKDADGPLDPREGGDEFKQWRFRDEVNPLNVRGLYVNAQSMSEAGL